MRLIELGKVGKPHGYRGEFIAITDNGRESALAQASQVFVGESLEQAAPYQVLSASWMPKGWKLKLSGIDSDALVKSLRGQSIFLDRSQLPAPPENEYYIGDLIGCQVLSADSEMPVGELQAVESAVTPGGVFQDRWVIRTSVGTLSVPAVQRYIARVDSEKRLIWLRNLSDLKDE